MSRILAQRLARAVGVLAAVATAACDQATEMDVPVYLVAPDTLHAEYRPFQNGTDTSVALSAVLAFTNRGREAVRVSTCFGPQLHGLIDGDWRLVAWRGVHGIEDCAEVLAPAESRDLVVNIGFSRSEVRQSNELWEPETLEGTYRIQLQWMPMSSKDGSRPVASNAFELRLGSVY